MIEREKFPSEAAERFQIRLPDGLRDEIRAAAERNGRSMNAEIVYRISGRPDRDERGALKVWLPEDLLGRIYHEANEAQLDPNLLIVDALEKAYPAPAPTFADLVEHLRDVVAKSAEVRPETREYLQLAEAALAADPHMAHRPVVIPSALKQPPWRNR